MEYKDYYATLGVPRNADEQAIRSAYRRLARQHHPDVNENKAQATEKFKEINEAYTVLSDPAKRRTYDGFGMRWEQAQRSSARPNGPTPRARTASHSAGGGPQAANTRTIDPEDLERIFRAFGGAYRTSSQRSGQTSDYSEFFEALFGGIWAAASGQNVTRAGHDIELDAQISLEEAFRGSKRTLTFDDGRRIEVTIPRGVDSGSRLRVKGQGERGFLGPRGDLYLTLQVQPHAKFTRQGNDLRIPITVDAETAQESGEVRVPTLERTVVLKIPAGTQSGQSFRLRGLGMPGLQNPAERGDLYAVVNVASPTRRKSADPSYSAQPSAKDRWAWLKGRLRRNVALALMAVGLVALVIQAVTAGMAPWLALATLAAILLIQSMFSRSVWMALGGLTTLLASGLLAAQMDATDAQLLAQVWPVAVLAGGFLLWPRGGLGAGHARPRLG
jgi:curved DNA-binding protein